MLRFSRFSLFSLLSTLVLALTLVMGCTRSEQIKGKVLRVVARDNIKTSDPTNAYDEVTLDIIPEIYEAPYQYNYYSDKIEVIPLLAEAMPTVSKDNLTYTFKIKKGIRFQDDPCFKDSQGKGRALTAHDLIYSWKRHANPANESQGFWIWDGKVVGVNDFQAKFGKGKAADEVMKEEVEGFKALDDYTVQIKLTKPYPQLVYILTMEFAAAVPHEAVAMYGKDFVNHPVGTGPFRAKEWSPTSKVVLVKNENYRDEFFPAADKLGSKSKQFAALSGKKLPIVDAIEFTVLQQEQPRWLGFLSGKYDQIKIPKDNFDAAVDLTTGDVKGDLKQKNITVSWEPSLILWYLSINVKDKVLGSSKLLRQAIALSVDRALWLKLFKNGRGSVQDEMNPPAIVDRCGTPYRWEYNIAKAKELMAKAGFPDGKGLPVFRYDTRSADPSERQLADFIAKNLSAIGVKVDITVNTFPAYLDKMNKGNLQLSKGGWSDDYPDAENNLQLLYGANKPPGPNETYFDHPEFNKLYDKVAAMAPSEARRKLICRMEEIVQDEVPWAYGIYENEYRLIQPWLKGYHTVEVVQNKYKYLDIDDTARESALAKR